MKHPAQALHRSFVFAGLASAFVLVSALSAQTYNWVGGNATTLSWGGAGNFSPNLSTTNSTIDLSFNSTAKAAGNATYNSSIGANRTIRSLTFGSNITTDFNTIMSTSSVITFQAASGNASLNILTGATGNIGFIGNATLGTGSQSLSSNLTINHNGSGTLLFNRQFAGVGGITKLGSGTMEVSAPNVNSFSGALNIGGGRLIAGSTASATGDFNSSSGIELSGGALEIRAGGFDKSINPSIAVTVGSRFLFNNSDVASSRNLTIGGTNAMSVNAALSIENISANGSLNNLINISRDISGGGNITITGSNDIASITSPFTPGRTQLSGNNINWSGGLVITKGAGQLSGNNSSGTGLITIGATGDASGAALALNTSGSLSLNNNVAVSTGGFRGLKSNGQTGTDIALNGGILLNGNLNLDHGLDDGRLFTINGNITGGGGLNVTRSAGSLNSSLAVNSLVLNGTNTFSGGLNIASNATVSIGNGGATGSIAGNVVNSGVLVFNRSNAYAFSGDISGVGALAKAGAGSFTFGGINSSSGNTTVNFGSLIVNGSFSNASNTVSVANGAALGGNGSITGNATFASGALFVFSPTATLNIGGTVTLDSGFGVASLINADGTAINWSGVGSGVYTLISAGGTFSGINNYGLPNAFDLGDGRAAYFQNSGLELFVGTPIPEPGSFALFGGLGAMAFVGLRRRRR